jgi:hypothetical protein
VHRLAGCIRRNRQDHHRLSFCRSPGDTVYTPPGEEHWHGATNDNFICHFAMLEGVADDDGTTWLDLVTDEEHEAANQR